MVCMFQLWPRLFIFYLKEALLQRIHLCSLISVCPPHVRQLRQSSTFHSRIDFRVMGRRPEPQVIEMRRAHCLIGLQQKAVWVKIAPFLLRHCVTVQNHYQKWAQVPMTKQDVAPSTEVDQGGRIKMKIWWQVERTENSHEHWSG